MRRIKKTDPIVPIPLEDTIMRLKKDILQCKRAIIFHKDNGPLKAPDTHLSCKKKFYTIWWRVENKDLTRSLVRKDKQMKRKRVLANTLFYMNVKNSINKISGKENKLYKYQIICNMGEMKGTIKKER